jgi:sulfur carrier protein
LNLIRLRPAKEGKDAFEALLLQGCFFNFGEVKMEMLKINGVERQFPAGQLPSTVAKLLEVLDIDGATAAAEIDGEIIDREKFAGTKLCNGQSIELVRFIGGG